MNPSIASAAASMKRIGSLVINDVILKPLGLKISFRVGSNPVEDMTRLLPRHSISIVVDGGAYEGSFSHECARAFPNATIHAFEPTPESYSRLERRAQRASAIVCHQLALGSECGTATLFVNASPLTNSLRKSSPVGHRYFPAFVAEQTTTKVQVVTLAGFANDHGVDAIDILKLDLQGNELDAIVGSGRLLETAKVIFTEVQFVELYENAPLFSEIESYLRGKGFVLYQLYGLVRSPKDGRLLYGDAMFVANELVNGIRPELQNRVR
jgi:FkbM family methyltransferase